MAHFWSVRTLITTSTKNRFRTKGFRTKGFRIKGFRTKGFRTIEASNRSSLNERILSVVIKSVFSCKICIHSRRQCYKHLYSRNSIKASTFCKMNKIWTCTIKQSSFFTKNGVTNLNNIDAWWKCNKHCLGRIPLKACCP